MDRRLLVGTALSAGAVLSLALPAHAQPAPNARPTGGSVVAGAATIAQSPTVTTVDQSSQRAAINWQSFNIGSQQTVQFQQPSASAVVLNRVVGPNPSQIAGRIDANGQAVITNQSGVVFYKGSQVNTAGLMVSAAGISNKNFMAGRMVFDRAANPNASITNQGSITVRDAGLAALVAPQVANSGVINARLGTVILAGARTATLDLYGDGLMAIDVTGQVLQAPNGATALVTNTGVIRADGGTVRLTAQAADGVVQTLVNAGGKIQANTVGNHTGTVVLDGVGGSITVAGQLSATGSAPGSTGGDIEINPSGGVVLAQGARIDASGQAGGGVVAVGTTLARAKGGPSVTSKHTAANVTVAAGATITANATKKGNGGHVTVLSGGTTVMDGTISAMGGPQGGNGGFVETSGPVLSIGNGAVVLAGARSPTGHAGTWLLDPLDLDVVNGSASSDNNVTQGGNPYTVTPNAAGATISNGTIQNELGTLGTNVILTTENTSGAATGNLTVDAGATITWNTAATLTMTAANNIAIDAAITGTAGTLTLTAGTATATPTGSITISAPISVNTLDATAGTTGTINLNVGTGTVVTTSGGGQVYGSPVVLQAASTLSDTGGGTIAFPTVDAAAAGGQGLTVSAGGGVAFDGAVGGVAALASLTVTGPTVLASNVTTTGAQTYNSAVTLDNTTLTVTATNGPVNFESTVDSPPPVFVRPSTFANLTVDASAVTFGEPVGATHVLASLTATGPTTLDGNVTTIGTQTYNSPVTLGGDVTLATTNAAVDFASTVDAAAAGSQGLTVNTGPSLTGTVTFGSTVGGAQKLASLNVTGPTTLDGNVTTSGTQTYNTPVTLGGTDTLATTNAAVDFASTMDATKAGGQGLTVNAGTGAVTFGGTVGGSPTSNTALASLTVTGPTTLNGNVTTTGTQTYNSPVALAATEGPTTTTLTTTNAAITLDGQVTGGANSLTLSSGTGAQTLSGVTTSGLTLTTTGPVTLDTGTYTIAGIVGPLVFPAVTMNGTLTFGQDTDFGAVTLGSDTTVGTASSGLTFTGTVDGAFALAANAGTGRVAFLGAVGGLTPLASLTVTGLATLDSNVTTTGAQTYNGAVQLDEEPIVPDVLTTTNAPVDFTGTVDNGGLTVNAGTGTVTFGNTVGGTGPLVSLTVTGPTTLGANVTTSGAQTYNSPVTLGGTATLATTNAAVDFASTVDATKAGIQGLTVNAGTGAVTFGGAVGGAQTLAGLAVTGPTTLDGNVTTTGTQTYNSAVTLGGTDTLATTNAAVDFASTVDATKAGGQGLTVNAGTGVVTFATTVGGAQALASLKVTGPTDLQGSVTTTGTQTYNSAVTLSATDTLATTNAAVDFAGTVDAARPDDAGLTVNAGTGAVTFGGAVGGKAELVDLTVTGPTRLDGSVTTFGAQTYNSAVTLGATDTLTTVFGAIDFAATVNAATADQDGLIVNAGTGAVTFAGVVGGTAALASLTASGETIVLDGNVTVGAGGGVTLQAPDGITTGNIEINAGAFITIDPNSPVTAGSGNNLAMLTQTGNILIGAGSPITASNGGNLTLQAGLTAGSGGTLTLNSNLATDEGGEVGRITLQADGGVALNATDLIAGTLDISNITSGGVSQATGGQIFITTLQSANGIAGNAGLTSTSNSVLDLGPLAVTGGTLTLNDESGLTINGPLAADFLNISAVGRITLAGNIATLGAPLTQQSGATPAPAGSTLTVVAEQTNFGTVAQFVQTGTSMLTDPPNTTLRIQLPATGGTATFANLVGPGADLVLGLGSGTATGAMQVAGLLVLGAGGSANLTGSIAGVTTQAAAALGQITPSINAAYTFNNCEIGLAACAPPAGTTTPGNPPGNPQTVTPPAVTPPLTIFLTQADITSVLGELSPFLASQTLPAVPPTPPLNLFVLPTVPLLTGELAPLDVVPPNISFEDY